MKWRIVSQTVHDGESGEFGYDPGRFIYLLVSPQLTLAGEELPRTDEDVRKIRYEKDHVDDDGVRVYVESR